MSKPGFAYSIYRFMRLMQKLGVSATLQQNASNPIDPVTGLPASASPVTWVVQACMSADLETFERAEDTRYFDLEMVFSAIDPIFNGATITPKQGDTWILNGQSYRIEKVDVGFIGDQISSYAIGASL